MLRKYALASAAYGFTPGIGLWDEHDKRHAASCNAIYRERARSTPQGSWPRGRREQQAPGDSNVSAMHVFVG